MAVERRTTTTTTEGVPTTSEHTVRDREVVREHHSDRGLGTLIVGALLVLVVAFLGIYMVNAFSDSDGGDVIPDEININDNSGGGAEAPADSGGAEAPADSGGAEAPADAPADSGGQ